MEELMTTGEIAKYLKLRRETIIRKAKGGEIPAIKIGRQFRFDKEQINRWLSKNLTGGMPDILVIDDDPVIGKLFQKTVRQYGSRVKYSASSLEALDILTRQQFDLIFLDLKMPVLDGSELFAKIRQLDQEVPVVIITGYPDSEIMERAAENGPFTIMKKPFSRNEIMNVVNSFIHKKMK